MSFWVGLPLELRVALIGCLAAIWAGQLNRAIYRWAWRPRAIGPWTTPDRDAPPRRCLDRVPIIGWIGLRRERTIHGVGYWIRPLLIELGIAVGFAWLYWAEMHLQLLPRIPRLILIPPDELAMHAQYVAHVVLLSLMTIATFIDFDDKIIPDQVTVPGTLAGLTLACIFPATAAPAVQFIPPASLEVVPLLATSPNAWPTWLNSGQGLFVGCLCFCAWCLAIWPRTFTMRFGVANGLRYLWASMFCRPGRWRNAAAMLLGCIGIAIGWKIGGASWMALLSSLIGMAFGGGLIWAVRLVAGRALGEEAMGFGDVTLMAMIGAFLGWHATLIIFFMAPFVAIVTALVQWLITGRRDIAFGPYLCIAALIVILRWSTIWEYHAKMLFALGWVIPGLVFFSLIMMAGLLRLIRLGKQAMGRA